MSKISLALASKYSGTKKDMHRIMEADGWYLPSCTSSMVTMDFLRDVRAKKVLCPRVDQVRLKSCRHPPKVDLLAEYLINGLTANYARLFTTVATREAAKALMQLLADKKPDSKWLIAVIATYLPTCDIFNKSYRPPKQEKEISMTSAPLVDNSDGLFTDIDGLT